jgi:cell division transport system permease protein
VTSSRPWWLVYALQRGLRGMGQSPLVALLAVGTMAVCMLLLGTVLLILDNTRAIAVDWGIEVPVTVYMADEGAADGAGALAARLERLPEVERVDHVTPGEALRRLDEGLGANASVLEGIDAQALPDSLEIHLRDGVEAGFASALAARVAEAPGVEDVAVLGPWADQANAMLATLRTLALGVGGLVSLACIAIVWSTIRLGVFARREEIQILRLVGGTPAFVRAPFLVEGMVQGVLGSALALALLWTAFDVVHPHLQQGLSLVFAAGSLHFFSPLQVALGIAFGAFLGALGSRAAVARYVEV